MTFTQAWMLPKIIRDEAERVVSVLNEELINKEIYPELKNIFKSFSFFYPYNCKVVILGQDPYHNPGSATGLAFQDGLDEADRVIKRPSLNNIEKKLGRSVDFEALAKKGVLWLNTALTVEQGKPNSHKTLWSKFTKYIIQLLNDTNDIVWVLWGGNALSYKKHITNSTHKFVISSHPSPLSFKKKLKEHQSFYDSDPFNKVNELRGEEIF